MLEVTVLGDEVWLEEEEVFDYPNSVKLQFEHSLVSLSKWEAEFHKLFLTQDEKTNEEMVGYIRAMLLTPGISTEVLESMSEDNLKQIKAYIDNPMTATTFSNLPPQKGRAAERLSAELIYFWMDTYGINYDARNWHLNQLFTLIRTHHAKSQKPQKMSTQAQQKSMAQINAERRARLGTTG